MFCTVNPNSTQNVPRVRNHLQTRVAMTGRAQAAPYEPRKRTSNEHLSHNRHGIRRARHARHRRRRTVDSAPGQGLIHFRDLCGVAYLTLLLLNLEGGFFFETVTLLLKYVIFASFRLS